MLIELKNESNNDVNFTNPDGMTGLYFAAMEGHLPIVQYLVSEGAKIDTRDNQGITAFVWASYEGHFSVCEYLLSLSSNSIVECDVATALKFAKRRRHKEIVSLIEPLMLSLIHI